MAFSLSQKDDEVRKQWLYFTAGLFLIYPIILYGILKFFTPPGAVIISPYVEYGYVLPSLAISLFLFVLELGFTSLIWYYAYKKHGTKLLSCLILLSLLAPLLNAVDLANGYNFLNLSIFLFETAALLVWIYLSIRLRRVNQKIQAKGGV